MNNHQAQARVVTGAEAVGARPLYDAARVVTGEAIAAGAMLEEARRVLDEAREQAAQILAQAQRQAGDAARAAAEEAAAQADARVREEGRQLFAQIELGVEEARAGLASQLQALALRLARAVVAAEFRLSPERVADVAAHAVRQARLCSSLEVHVSPDDEAMVRSCLSRPGAGLAPGAQVSVVADADLPRGSVRVRTETGLYDASLDVQFDRLERALLGEGA